MLNDQRYRVHPVCVLCFAGVVCFVAFYTMAGKCAFAQLFLCCDYRALRR